MERIHREKIVVIGAGKVGEAIAYTLMVRALANDIVLIDADEGKAKGAALDIAHGTSYYEHIWVREGGYEECVGAHAIIIAAGIARKPGQTRLDLTKTNVAIIEKITENIMKHVDNPLILVVTNPVDLATLTVWKKSGLPAGRVIGTGTSLDSARFRYHLSKKLQVNIEDIKAYILGEHGDTQVPIFSSANIGGYLLDDFAKHINVEIDKEAIADRIRNGGAEIIGLKGATYYGIAMAVASIVEAIIKDNNAIIPVSHVLDESFGDWAGVAVSFPCRIDREGINETLIIPMNDEERASMERCIDTLRELERQVLEQE